MSRLLVHVEGQTEEEFVNELIRPHLLNHGYSSVSARLIGNARLRSQRGGIKAWVAVRDDISRHLLHDSGAYSTTMVDYYALPATGAKAWPGRDLSNKKPFPVKAATVEVAILNNLEHSIGAKNVSKFVPYIVMHEFEALLFSDCNSFATGIGRPDLCDSFQAIRDQFETPEGINDSPHTAPSKRISKLYPGYQKPLLGNLAALEIGLARIRAACPNFSNWLEKLESLPKIL